MINYYLITFKSITFVMQFEKLMKTHNLDIKIIPVPRSISTSCGMCGKIPVDKKEAVLQLCEQNNIDYVNIFEF